MSTPALDVQPRGSTRTSYNGGDFAHAMQAVVPFVTLTLVLLSVKPPLLRPLFPAAAVFVGYRIYKRNESYYASFVLWMYMLAPLLRRAVDWRASYQEQSMILLAPLLVTLLPGIDLRRRLVIAAPLIRIAALLSLGGIAFGAGIGMIRRPGANVLLATATWSAPIVLCVFAASIRERDLLGRVLTRTFLWGVLLMSVYGAYQFVVAPPWDTYWLKEISASSVAPSFGQPEPMGIRVWSTMNAPGPLAVMLSAALIWLAACGSAGAALIAFTGYGTLLLTLVRAAWAQTAIGWVALTAGCRARLSWKGTWSLILIAGVLVTCLRQLPQMAEVKQRFASFLSLRNDESAIERQEVYHYLLGRIATTPMGEGLDTVTEIHGHPIDSSLLLLFYMLGWPGALCYLSALATLTVHLIVGLRSFSRHRVAAAAIALSSITQIISGDVVYRQGGLLFWLFVGVWARLTFDV